MTQGFSLLGSINDGGVSQGKDLTQAPTAAEPRHAAGQDVLQSTSQTSSLESEVTQVSTVANFLSCYCHASSHLCLLFQAPALHMTVNTQP